MTTDCPPASITTRDDARQAQAVKPIEPTAAQRQRAYRLRRKRAAIEAIGEEADASRVTLLALLAHDLAKLEARTTSETMNQTSRSSVKRILNAIVTRYGIEP